MWSDKLAISLEVGFFSFGDDCCDSVCMHGHWRIHRGIQFHAQWRDCKRKQPSPHCGRKQQRKNQLDRLHPSSSPPYSNSLSWNVKHPATPGQPAPASASTPAWQSCDAPFKGRRAQPWRISNVATTTTVSCWVSVSVRLNVSACTKEKPTKHQPSLLHTVSLDSGELEKDNDRCACSCEDGTSTPIFKN